MSSIVSKKFPLFIPYIRGGSLVAKEEFRISPFFSVAVDIGYLCAFDGDWCSFRDESIVNNVWHMITEDSDSGQSKFPEPNYKIYIIKIINK